MLRGVVKCDMACIELLVLSLSFHCSIEADVVMGKALIFLTGDPGSSPGGTFPLPLMCLVVGPTSQK